MRSTAILLQWGLLLTPALAIPSKRSGSCSFSYTADASDTCETMASTWDITVDQFRSYNPSVKDCTKLTAGANYCVEWKGDPPPGPSTTSTSPVTTTPATTTTGAGQSPTQSGGTPTCTDSYLVRSGDNCWKIATDHNLTLEQFLQWNPSLNADCGNLYPNDRVCVSPPGGSVTTTRPPTTTQTPNPIQPGTPDNCKKYYLVQHGQGCWDVEQQLGISDSDFRKWNPGLNAGCSNLREGYYVCIQP